MGDQEPSAGGMDLSYATPLPRRRGWGVLVIGAVGLALVVGLGGLVYLLRRGYTMSIRLAPPATAPATAPAPAAAPPAVPGIPGYVPPPPPKLDLPDAPPRLTIYQRGSDSIPGSDGTVHISVGDITGGQARVDVTAGNVGTLATKTLREGEAVDFALDGKQYVVVATEFRLRLTGRDSGVFVVRRDEDPVTEEERIGRLISAAAAAKAVVSTQPETPQVGDHLRSVWRLNRTKIKTAEDLIRETGKETARFPDGKETALELWLSGELDKLK